MTILELVLVVAYILNVIINISLHNWPAVLGWTCALIMFSVYYKEKEK